MTKTSSDGFINSLRTVNWKWVLERCAAVLAVVVVFMLSAFCPLNRYTFNLILFHPMKYPGGLYDTREVAGCKKEDVFFKASDGNQIHAWFLRQPKARLTVLLSHGNGGNLTWRMDLIEMLLKSGVSVFAYDYEGYGRSEGQAGVESACDDARCAYNYLVKEKKIDPNTIVLAGESLGTGITSNLASKVSCAGVILQCPFMSLRHRAVELLAIEQLYPKAFYPENALDEGDVFSKKHSPLLVVAGTIDQMLPVHHADDLVAMSLEPKTYIRVEGAGHTGDPALVNSKIYQGGLKKFFADIDKSLVAKRATCLIKN